MPSDRLSRRDFLTAAGAGVAALTTAGEADGVDARLARKVTLGVEASALADLCAKLRADTGIHLGAGASVADEPPKADFGRAASVT
jgi:TAT (twin-arginine translocation) pathway signal sequence